MSSKKDRTLGSVGKALLVVLVVGAFLALPGIATGETYRVRATGDDKWSPSYRHVLPGTRIVWKNPTNRTHDVFAYRGDWDKYVILSPGERTAKTFKRRGTYQYRCKIHSRMVDRQCRGMCGTVHVDNY